MSTDPKFNFNFFQMGSSVSDYLNMTGDEADGQNAPAEYKIPFAASIVTSLSRYGLLASRSIEEPQIQLGQLVLRLVAAINTQRTGTWNAQAHLDFAAIVIGVLAQGRETFETFCASPVQYSISVRLGRFIQAYVAQHAGLYTLNVDSNFANQLKRELSLGNLEALHQRFGLDCSEELASISQKRTCAVM